MPLITRFDAGHGSANLNQRTDCAMPPLSDAQMCNLCKKDGGPNCDDGQGYQLNYRALSGRLPKACEDEKAQML